MVPCLTETDPAIGPQLERFRLRSGNAARVPLVEWISQCEGGAENSINSYECIRMPMRSYYGVVDFLPPPEKPSGEEVDVRVQPLLEVVTRQT